jgi:hypothetical protein
VSAGGKKQVPGFGYRGWKACLANVYVWHAEDVALLRELSAAVPDPAG